MPLTLLDIQNVSEHIVDAIALLTPTAADPNRLDTREVHLVRTKLEEALMWLQHGSWRYADRPNQPGGETPA